ncbi:Ionotropic receptor 93a, partial [Gryllus bimaculatus]
EANALGRCAVGDCFTAACFKKPVSLVVASKLTATMVAGSFFSIALLALCSNYPLQPDSKGAYPPPECKIREPKLLEGRTINIVTLDSPPLSNIGEEDKEGNHKGDGIVFEFINILMYKYGFKYNVSLPKTNVLGDNNSSRILFATWWIFITILTSFYTANLTAFLTLSKFTLPIKDAKDIAKYRYRWIAQQGGPLEHLVDTNEDFDYLKASQQKGYGKFLKKTDVEMLEEIQKNNLMYLREKNAVEHLMLKDYNEKAKDRSLEEKERCTFVMTPDAFMAQTIAFAYKMEGDLHIPFDKVLLSLVETGIVKFLMRRDLPQVQVCPLDLGSKERQLRNADLWMTYMVVITGFSTSIAVFAAEMLIRLYRYCNARELQKHEEMAQQYPGDWKSMAFKKSQLQAPYGIFGANVMPTAPAELGMNGQPKLMPMRGSESAFMFQYTA